MQSSVMDPPRGGYSTTTGGSAETRRAVKHARGERNNERSRETPHDSDRYFSQAWATRELPRACLFSSVVKGPRRQMTLTSLWLPHGRVITGHKHSFVGNFSASPKVQPPILAIRMPTLARRTRMSSLHEPCRANKSRDTSL